MIRVKYSELPANAKTILTIQSCIDCLKNTHPYPGNMKIDRENFAIARLGYEAAIYQLEKFQCELTEEIVMELIGDE